MRAESYPQSPGTTRCGERANRAFPHPYFKIFKVLSVAITLLHFRRLISHILFSLHSFHHGRDTFCRNNTAAFSATDLSYPIFTKPFSNYDADTFCRNNAAAFPATNFSYLIFSTFLSSWQGYFLS